MSNVVPFDESRIKAARQIGFIRAMTLAAAIARAGGYRTLARLLGEISLRDRQFAHMQLDEQLEQAGKINVA